MRALIYLAAMVPEPGVSLNDQFGRDRMLLPGYVGGLESSDRGGFSRWVDFDVCYRTGCHDCQEAVARERFERSRSQRNRPYRTPCSLAGPAGRAYALHPVQRGPHHGQFLLANGRSRTGRYRCRRFREQSLSNGIAARTAVASSAAHLTQQGSGGVP